MTINLQRGQFLRVVDGAGSTVTAHGGAVWITEERRLDFSIVTKGQAMKRLLFAFSLAATTLAGCAQFVDSAGPAGATSVEEQNPYPTRFRNDNRHPA
jgi:hypothetical protein